MATKKKVAKKIVKKAVAVPPYQQYDLVNCDNTAGYTGRAIVARVKDDGMPDVIQRETGGWSRDNSVPSDYKPVEGFDDFWSVRGEENFTLIKRNDKAVKIAKAAAPELGMKFALKYDLDRDPVELFATRAEVRARIAELVAKDRSLKKDSIWVYKVSAPKHITVSTAISSF